MTFCKSKPLHQIAAAAIALLLALGGCAVDEPSNADGESEEDDSSSIVSAATATGDSSGSAVTTGAVSATWSRPAPPPEGTGTGLAQRQWEVTPTLGPSTEITPADAKILGWLFAEDFSTGTEQYPQVYSIHLPEILIDTPVTEVINSEIRQRFYDEAKEVSDELAAKEYTRDIYALTTHYTIVGGILSIRIALYFAPIYGTDGRVYTVNYDMVNDCVLPVAFLLEQRGLNSTAVLSDALDWYRASWPERTGFGSAELSGFYFGSDGAVHLIVNAVANAVTDPPEGIDSCNCIFEYPLPA